MRLALLCLAGLLLGAAVGACGALSGERVELIVSPGVCGPDAGNADR